MPAVRTRVGWCASHTPRSRRSEREPRLADRAVVPTRIGTAERVQPVRTVKVEGVAGGHVDLKMKVTIGTNAPRGSTRALTVTVKSKTVKTIKDVAQVRVKRA